MFASKDTLLTRPSGYNIARSVRLRSSASAYFNRTPASAGNRQKFTISAWVKRGKLTTSSGIFGAGATSANEDRFMFAGNDTLLFDSYIPGTNFNLNSTAVYRDPSAWYHVVGAVDTTQATASDRVKLYVNGAQITSFVTATYPAQNANCNINNNVAQYIGNNPDNYYYDGYLTEINFIDGQALTPSSFGETDSITGVWKAKKYAGTYGTNGFYLNFSDNSASTATTIGKDYSGNGNNWTPNNISTTAGATYDSMVDSPTVGATSSNYAVWNPIDHPTTFVAPTNGNLSQNCNTSSWTLCVPTFAIPDGSGLWQWEFVQTGTANGANAFGVCLTTVQASVTGSPSGRAGCSGVDNTGVTFINGSTSGSITYPTVGNTITCLYDATNRTFQVFDNGVSKGTITGLPAGDTRPFVAASSSNGSPTFVANFGQTAFSYDKNGKALNTYNLPASTITNGAAYMAATTYTGNGSTQSISNAVGSTSFQPDFVWIKDRNTARGSMLFDSVRGIYIRLRSNTTDAEQTETDTLTAFNSNGFNLSTNVAVNGSTETYVGWQWKAGTTSASNTNGSITSTVSAGATQGFSVVTYTGTGVNATVGHGLGVAPNMYIVKNRTGTVGYSDWYVYHTTLGAGAYLFLNQTLGTQSSTGVWNNTSPTSTVFSLGAGSGGNFPTANYVAYCFSAVAGYSAFGSFSGNGSADGPFVYTGFRPAFVMAKLSSATGDWNMVDDMRQTYNDASGNPVLRANLSNTEEDVDTMQGQMDILSNGFKLRSNNSSLNANGGTIIYAAFAKSPFKFSNAR